MKRKIYNNDGPFPTWREESAEETLVRNINLIRTGEKKEPEKPEKIIGAGNIYITLNQK